MGLAQIFVATRPTQNRSSRNNKAQGLPGGRKTRNGGGRCTPKADRHEGTRGACRIEQDRNHHSALLTFRPTPDPLAKSSGPPAKSSSEDRAGSRQEHLSSGPNRDAPKESVLGSPTRMLRVGHDPGAFRPKVRRRIDFAAIIPGRAVSRDGDEAQNDLISQSGSLERRVVAVGRLKAVIGIFDGASRVEFIGS